MADRSPEVRVEHGVDDWVEGGAGQGQPLDDRHHSLTGRGARGEEGLGITAVIEHYVLSLLGSHQTDVNCPEGEVAADEGRDQEAGHPGQPPLPRHVCVHPAEGLASQPRQGILQEVGHGGVSGGLPRAENQRQTGGWSVDFPSWS